jgi:hypothetical protein
VLRQAGLKAGLEVTVAACDREVQRVANNIEDDYRRTIAILEQLGRGLHTAFDQEPNASPSVENRRERLSAGLRAVAIFIEKLVARNTPTH